MKPGMKIHLRKWVKGALWIVGGGSLVGFAFIFSFFMAMKIEMRSTEVVVPDLATLSMEEARRAAGDVELRLEVVDHRHDPAVASGRILQQEPPAGSLVRRGRKVNLVMSLGGKVLKVPDLIGKAARAVEIRLRRDGFVPGDEARAHSAEVPADRVLAQDPPGGGPAGAENRVHARASTRPYVSDTAEFSSSTGTSPSISPRTMRNALPRWRASRPSMRVGASPGMRLPEWSVPPSTKSVKRASTWV